MKLMRGKGGGGWGGLERALREAMVKEGHLPKSILDYGPGEVDTSTTSELEMEKREHQLTTSKLTQLLKKRGVSVPDGGGSEEEIQRLRQTVRAQHSLQALMLRTREDSRHQLLRR